MVVPNRQASRSIVGQQRETDRRDLDNVAAEPALRGADRHIGEPEYMTHPGAVRPCGSATHEAEQQKNGDGKLYRHWILSRGRSANPFIAINLKLSDSPKHSKLH